MTNKKPKEMKVVIYKDENGMIEMDVKLLNENIWLSRDQIANLFSTDRTSISRHIKNIFSTDELDRKSNVQKMHILNSDRQREAGRFTKSMFRRLEK